MEEGRCRSSRSCCCSRWTSVACEGGEGCPSRTGCWEETWKPHRGPESKVWGLVVDRLMAVLTPFLTLRSVGIACWVNEGRRQERRGRRSFS